jgi:hypothetical protein
MDSELKELLDCFYVILEKNKLFEKPLNRFDPVLQRGLPKEEIVAVRKGHSLQIRMGYAYEETIRMLSECKCGESSCFHPGAGVSQLECENWASSHKCKKTPVILSKYSKEQLERLINNRPSQQWSRQSLLKLMQEVKKTLAFTDEIHTHPIDVIDPVAKMLGEIKATANLDTGKAPNMVVKDMLKPYLAWGIPEADLRLFVIYDSSPEGKSWNTNNYGIKQLLSEDMIVVEEETWKFFLPKYISAAEWIEGMGNQFKKYRKNQS